MQKTGVGKPVLPRRATRGRAVTKSIKRIVADAATDPETYLRTWCAGRGGE